MQHHKVNLVHIESDLQKIDLNLLRMFEVLYEERSVTRTAERLYLTPSAVSHALGRLREIVADELFTRKHGAMTPTPRAHGMARQLQTLLPQLVDVLSPPHFDPLTSEQTFALACVPSLLLTVVPRLATIVAQQAPHVRMITQRLQSSAVDDLDSGRLDVAIGHFRGTPPQFVAQDLLSDTYVWVIDARSPVCDEALTPDVLSSLPHIDLRIENLPYEQESNFSRRHGLDLVVQNASAEVDRAMAEAGLRRNIRYQAPDAFAGMCMAASTGAICLVPNLVARYYAPMLGLKTIRAEFGNMALHLQMLTHREFGRHPAVDWFAQRIVTAAELTERD